MIPLNDVDRRPGRFTLVTMIIISLNVFLYVLEVMRGSAFVAHWALVPAWISAGRDLTTLVTAMFLHGSLLHIAGSMIYFRAENDELHREAWFPSIFKHRVGTVLVR